METFQFYIDDEQSNFYEGFVRFSEIELTWDDFAVSCYVSLALDGFLHKGREIDVTATSTARSDNRFDTKKFRLPLLGHL